MEAPIKTRIREAVHRRVLQVCLLILQLIDAFSIALLDGIDNQRAQMLDFVCNRLVVVAHFFQIL